MACSSLLLERTIGSGGVEGAKLRVLANVTYGIVWILVPVMKECADETSC
jgi:hypothetical protein